MNKTKSFIWQIPLEDFRNTIEQSTTWTEVIQKYYNRQTNPRVIKARVKKEGISTSHFLGQSKYKNMKCAHNSHPRYKVQELLQKNLEHKIPNQRLKTKLLENHLLVDQCYSCGLRNTWNGKPLTLQLVHINGDSYDNQLQNIIIQCPNCNSQLKHGNNNVIFLDSCTLCNINIPSGRKKCVKCCRLSSHRSRPDKETLQKELVILDFEGVQRKYGVDKDQIIKWINLN